MANMRHDFPKAEPISNRALIDRTIASIRRGPFDMLDWDCCIAGHVLKSATRHGPLRDPLSKRQHTADICRRMLQISIDQAVELFTGPDSSRAEAIRCLEILRDEGVVDWDRAKRPPNLATLLKAEEILDEPLTLDEAEAAFDDLVAEVRALA